MLVQLQMAWRECLLPCPGLGPIWGAQAGPKEVVLLVKTKPSPRWLDKVVTAEERPEKEKRIKETGCPSLPLPPNSTRYVSWSLWPFLVLVPLPEYLSSLCLSG